MTTSPSIPLSIDAEDIMGMMPEAVEDKRALFFNRMADTDKSSQEHWDDWVWSTDDGVSKTEAKAFIDRFDDNGDGRLDPEEQAVTLSTYERIIAEDSTFLGEYRQTNYTTLGGVLHASLKDILKRQKCIPYNHSRHQAAESFLKDQCQARQYTLDLSPQQQTTIQKHQARAQSCDDRRLFDFPDFQEIDYSDITL